MSKATQLSPVPTALQADQTVVKPSASGKLSKRVREVTFDNLEVLSPAVTGTEAGIGLVNEFHDLARTSMAQSCAYMILAGVELLALKKDVKHGEWEKLFPAPGDQKRTACAFAVPLRTAQKYMGIAAAGKKHIAALQEVCNSGTPLSLMSPEQRETLVHAVRKLGDGKTYSDLADEWGLAKTKRGANSKGGHQPGEGDGDPEDPVAAAVDTWSIHLKNLTLDGIDHPTWADLPDSGEVTKKTVGELLVDLGQQMLAAHHTAKKGAKGK